MNEDLCLYQTFAAAILARATIERCSGLRTALHQTIWDIKYFQKTNQAALDVDLNNRSQMRSLVGCDFPLTTKCFHFFQTFPPESVEQNSHDPPVILCWEKSLKCLRALTFPAVNILQIGRAISEAMNWVETKKKIN